MVFLGVLLFIILAIWGVFVWAELYHGQKSVFTPIGFIVLGIIGLLMGEDGALWGIILLIVGVAWFIKYKSDEQSGVHEMERERERQQIEIERQNAIASQQKKEPWAIRYMIFPCPYCGHYKVRYAKWEDKQFSVAFWGVASDKLGKNYKCEHCQRMWE